MTRCWNSCGYLLGDEQPQLVMSDMAPNTTGIADVDHDRSMHLVELSLDFARQRLAPGGDFLVKVFQGRPSSRS